MLHAICSFNAGDTVIIVHFRFTELKVCAYSVCGSNYSTDLVLF